MSSLIGAALAGVLLTAGLVPTVMAADYDGSKPLICAAQEAVICHANVDCKRGAVESLGIPQFFWVDFAAKTMAEKGPDGRTRSSIIQTVAQGPTHMILQGTKDNLGWTGTISKTSGKLTLTGSDGALGMVVFGTCTPTK
jgi:hypothetical protein